MNGDRHLVIMPNGWVLCVMYKREKIHRHTVLLHDREELDDDLGGRSDQDLALASLLSVVDGVERIVEDGSLNHFVG